MSSEEEEVSQQDSQQLEGHPLLDQLLLLAEERQDHETLASQQTKVQTLAQCQVNPQAQPQTTRSQVNPQAQPQVTQAQPVAPRQPPLSPHQQPKEQTAPPPAWRLVPNPLNEEDKQSSVDIIDETILCESRPVLNC